MSMILMVQAMQVKVGNPTRKLVLLKLADNANDEGVCWPSYDNIAEQCEISRRSAIRHINELENSGLVKRSWRKGEKGNKSNIFQLTLGGDNLTPPSDKLSPGVVTEDHHPSDTVSPRTSHGTSHIDPNKKIDKKSSAETGLLTPEEYPKELNLSAWSEWLEYRKKILKKPYKSKRGEQTALTKLLNLSKNNLKLQQHIVDQSIDNEWQGLFEFKGGSPQPQQQTTAAIGESYHEGMDVSKYQLPEHRGQS